MEASKPSRGRPRFQGEVGKSGESRRRKLLELSEEELQAHRAAEVARVTAAKKSKPVAAVVDTVDQSDEDVSSSEEEGSHEKRGKTTQISFGGKFEADSIHLPQSEAEFVTATAETMQVENHTLWASFLVFVLQYIAARPQDLVEESGKKAVAALKEQVAMLRSFPILVDGITNKIFPYINTFCRDRSFFMYRAFKRIWTDGILTVNRMNLWFLLLCVFRYCGSSLVFEDVFFSRNLRGKLAQHLQRWSDRGQC